MIEEHGLHLFLSLLPFLFLAGYFLVSRVSFSGLRILALLFLVLFSIHIFGGLHIGHSTISHSNHSVSECCVMPQSIETPLLLGLLFDFIPERFVDEENILIDFKQFVSVDNKSPPLG